MLTQIKASTFSGTELILPVMQDNASGFTVRSVDGLNPTQATIVTSTFALLDGSNYQASSVDNRNIMITVGLEPFHGGLTVKQLRDQLYKVYMPKNRLDLTFYDHSLSDNAVYPYTTFGWVESVEMNMFSPDPEVIISIVCTDPFFYDPAEQTINGTTVQDATNVDVNYAGTSETGFVLELPITVANVNNVILYRELGFGVIDSFDISHTTFQIGDKIVLSTIEKKKTITLVRNNAESSLLYTVRPESRWLTLVPGSNKVRVYTNVGAMPYTIKYKNRYGGL